MPSDPQYRSTPPSPGFGPLPSAGRFRFLAALVCRAGRAGIARAALPGVARASRADLCVQGGPFLYTGRRGTLPTSAVKSSPDRLRAAIQHRRLDALGDPLPGEADLLVQQGRLAMGDISVGQADSHDPRPTADVARLVQGLPHRGA